MSQSAKCCDACQKKFELSHRVLRPLVESDLAINLVANKQNYNAMANKNQLPSWHMAHVCLLNHYQNLQFQSTWKKRREKDEGSIPAATSPKIYTDTVLQQ